MKEIVIPRNVVRIEDNAFYGCYSLKEVVLEDCSNSIGMGTNGYDKKSLFYDCPSLIPQHYNLTLFISSWATKSCPGFCHVRIFTYLSVAKRKQAKL